MSSHSQDGFAHAAASASAPAPAPAPAPAQSSTSGKVTQPPWQLPVPEEPAPTLKVWNSLTRSKTEFVPMRAKHVTWYNCGPTVYDSSHMGHARNYVTQDIVRRILRDYLGYDVHFVMNITDIDDKIIVRARQAHLFSSFRTQHSALTAELCSTVQRAWAAHYHKTIAKFAPPTPPNERDGSEGLAEAEAGWEEISRLRQDAKWLAQTTEKEPKFGMWYTALDASRQAQVMAAVSLGASNTDKSQAESLIDASQDVLSSYLDKELGHTVTEPKVFRDLAAYWESSFFEDMRRLHVERPTTLTRVSEYIPEIVSFVERIIGNGFAYAEGAEGKRNVWFDTRAFDGARSQRTSQASSAEPNSAPANGVQKNAEGEWNHSYAKLAPWSKGNRELLEEGEGSLSTSAAVTGGKRTPSDFALWKSSKAGEPAWPSPWGPGRPGWHIECSVMASEVLGSRMDMHSGGVDLMFPHHDNEIAQSEAHHDCRQWVNYFLHTGHLHIEGLKMSKSLKNFISIDEALQRFSARQLRLAFLLQQWNVKMDFRERSMAEVRNAENVFNNFFASTKAKVREALAGGDAVSDGRHHYTEGEKELMAALARAQTAFRAAMCDSFDTPTGMAVLLDLISRANIYERGRPRADVNVAVLEAVAKWTGDMLRMLGLGEGPAREGDIGWGDAVAEGEAGAGADREEILMPYLRALSSFRDSIRQLARSNAPHAEILKLADQLRDIDMVDLGVALEDQEDGKALVKLVPAAQLQAAREEARQAATEKAARKAEAAEKRRVQRLEALNKGRVAPSEMFRAPACNEGYTAWDEQGIPTIDKEGKDLAKKRRKNLEKEYEKQGKLHADFLAAKEVGEIE